MFLSCGDALFDLFAEDGGDASTITLTGRIGGSPLNVALGLARLGHEVGYFTKVSSDLFGHRIRSFMQLEGIGQQFLVPTDRNTTLAMVALSEAGGAQYTFHIDGAADRSIEPSDVPETFPDALAAIHVGSYSTVTEPTASALLRLVSRESGACFISYDPNVRPSIEPDLDVWRAKVAELVPHAALIKASEEDLELLYPGRGADAVLTQWVEAGAGLAVLTRGEAGALALAANGTAVSAPGLAVSVVDTVGAGDTFQAGLLARLREERMLSRAAMGGMDREALTALLGFAVRAAAVTCSRRGADLPRRADLGLSPLAI